MNNCAIVGVNWGDEGKGRMVDLLCRDYDIVVRYQGGGNAGHTVVNDKGKFALHLLPSGIFHENTINILGNGVALDIENLAREIEELRTRGISITPDNLKISERASILLPWHRDLDEYEELRLADRKYGSTKQGIAPFYSDKYQKKTIMVGELFYPSLLEEHLQELLEWKNLIIKGLYGQKEWEFAEIRDWISKYAEIIKPFITDTGAILRKAEKDNKKVLFEAQLGTLRDLDFGIYPYTTSTNTLSAYGPVGAGYPPMKIDRVIGVVKAYSTCVGEGPFVSELTGEEAARLREAGQEYGAKTGRARRVGAFDSVATRYGALMQGTTEIALTKIDVLSYLDKIPVCVKYLYQGKELTDFPFPAAMEKCEPVIEYMDGWKCDISAVRNYEELPEMARKYISFIEEACKCQVKYISVGPHRDAIIIR